MQYNGNVDIYRVIIKCQNVEQLVETRDQIEKSFADRDLYPDKGYPYGSIHLSIPVSPSVLTEWDPWYILDGSECHLSACYIQDVVNCFGSDRVEGFAVIMPDWWDREMELLRRKMETESKNGGK